MKKYLFLYICALTASLGGLLSGYDTGVISGALLYINQSFEMSSALLGFLVSSVSIGAIIGALINGALIDKIGRKKILLITAFIFIIASVFCYLSQNIIELILSRMLIGCAVGAVSFAGPLYLSEISVKEKRGEIVSFHQLAITFGILFSYLTNYFCANLENNWRVMLLAGAFPAIILFIAMMFFHDTPRWYVTKGKIDKAKSVLKRIDCGINLEDEILHIKNTLDDNKKIKLEKRFIMPFVIGIGIMFAQIATGINAIIYYAPTIFKMVGFSSNQDVLFATVFIGLINFLMTFVAIVFVDKIGRKPLLYFGLTGVMISLFALGTSFAFADILGDSLKWVAVGSLVTYIVCFAMSLGPIGWILVSEVFPLKIRGVAMSVCTVANFAFNFFVVASFPVLLHRIGGAWTFWMFGIVSILCIIFVYFFVPETKGISLEQIESNWRKGVKPRDF